MISRLSCNSAGKDGKNGSEGIAGIRIPAQESYLHTTVDFLLSHNMLLRDEGKRAFELPNFFAIKIDEGPTACWPMIMMKNLGEDVCLRPPGIHGSDTAQGPLAVHDKPDSILIFLPLGYPQRTCPTILPETAMARRPFVPRIGCQQSHTLQDALQWMSEVFRAVGPVFNSDTRTSPLSKTSV